MYQRRRRIRAIWVIFAGNKPDPWPGLPIRRTRCVPSTYWANLGTQSSVAATVQFPRIPRRWPNFVEFLGEASYEKMVAKAGDGG
jgi:hypothetical protein